jgi:DNA-binding MarR family transcriptional regulator
VHQSSDPVDASEVAALVVAVYDAASALRQLGDAEAGVAGQTQARWQVMYVAANGRWTVPQIARRLGVQRQSVQRVVNRLREEGLVDLAANPDHATSPLVQLTPGGTEVLAVINDVADTWHRRVANTADHNELRTTVRFLAWLRAIAEADLADYDARSASGGSE